MIFTEAVGAPTTPRTKCRRRTIGTGLCVHVGGGSWATEKEHPPPLPRSRPSREFILFLVLTAVSHLFHTYIHLASVLTTRTTSKSNLDNWGKHITSYLQEHQNERVTSKGVCCACPLMYVCMYQYVGMTCSCTHIHIMTVYVLKYI